MNDNSILFSNRHFKLPFLSFPLNSLFPHFIPPPAHPRFYPPPMKTILMIVGVIALTMMTVVEGDDTQALRHTLSSLCSLNNVGTFSSCCASYDINSITLDNKTTWSCFINSLSATESALTTLFVPSSCLSFDCSSSFLFSQEFEHQTTECFGSRCLLQSH